MGRLIIALFGLMGTGKTKHALNLAGALGWPVIHSDALRKRLAGLAPTDRVPADFGKGIYAEDFSQRTYGEMRRLARQHLETGPGVILDASFKRAGERDLVRQLAREAGAEAAWALCTCPPDAARERLGIRLTDPEAISDGRVELFEAQARDFDPPEASDRPLLILETGRPFAEVFAELKDFVTRIIGQKETTMQPEEIIERIKQRAKDNFKTGLNCAECVFEAVLAQVDTGLPPETMCVMTGFGAGGGLFGDNCGALVGAMAALGAVYGRRQVPPDFKTGKEELYGNPGLYRLFNRVPNEFKKRFGSTQCRVLTEKWHSDWNCRDRALFCRDLVVGMAGLAAEMAVPKDQDRWASQPLGDNVEGLT